MATLDLVIRNGTIVDGSGMGRYRADVGVADGRDRCPRSAAFVLLRNERSMPMA